MEIPGPSLDDMTRRATSAARHMRNAIKIVLTGLARDVDADVPSADDLVRAQVLWERQVDKVLQPDVRAALLFGGDLVRKMLGDDVPSVTNPYAEWYLLTTRNRLSGVGGLVWEVARQELLDGMANGEDVKALRSRVRNATGFAAPRAETVARTEVNGAMNAGGLIQMQATGLPFKKTWLATAGARTRPSHARADGQTRSGTQKFVVGGWPMDRPHDPAAPPEETENCRCTMTFEIKDPPKRRKKDEPKDLLDVLLSGAEMHNQPGDHAGGTSSISRDDLDSMSESTDAELTSHERTMLDGYRKGYEDRDEVTDLISGNVNYRDQLQSELSRHAPEGELTIYRGGEQTGRYGNGSLDRDMAGLFGSGLANPKGGPVTEHVIDTTSIRAIGAVNEMEIIYDLGGIVASAALHNQPGDHAGRLHGAAAFDVVPAMSDRNIAYGYMENSNDINSACRTGKKSSAVVTDHITTLDSEFAAASPLRDSIVVYRGVGDRRVEDVGIGSSWTDRGYMSTSVHREIAESYGGTLVQMKVPKGGRALQVDSVVGEVLLPRSTTFQVTGTQGETIRAEVV